ncbi:MAG TPA: transposase [Candidatus Eisenbergiella merdipullorum]|uniref:Transposase n=1 Tax=Candidatus Eisenbergiella merdipullorum TaxID=2838553 RepID=A0A9D2I3M7_9FIRM|nr:transposase [Candidatus Eisenbergiella merdipullorum]
MYKPIDKLQHSFLDFNQPLGMKMNPENRWIRLADRIPWDELEKKYADLFPSDTGNVAKPLRMALGSLIIQKKFQFSDRELVEQITENPYLQYFIGLPSYQDEPPFDPSTLVLFRKRLDIDAIMAANAMMFDHRNDDDNPPSSGSSSDAPSSSQDKTDPGTTGNEGTLIVDATCAPANIRYPQDISLLNEAREKLETIILRFCKDYDLALPRRYARRARKDYLAYAKCRRHTQKQTRKAIKKQLSYVRRDLAYLDNFMSADMLHGKRRSRYC